MLTIKQINEISFRKSGFSGYKPEDVDDFIDEVGTSFTTLVKENQMLKAKASELSSKNAEIREKLSILAGKIEAYRDDEDGIKNALLSAQKLGTASIREAKAKAEAILTDANAKAEDMRAEAQKRSTAVIESYQEKIANKERELETLKAAVTTFRSSLYDMYRNHLNAIESIPDFSEELAQTNSTVVEQVVATPPIPQPVPAPVYTPPVAVSEIDEIPDAVFDDLGSLLPEDEEELQLPSISEDTFGEIDFNAYSDIPEALKNDKAALYSTLEFGDDVDIRKKK